MSEPTETLKPLEERIDDALAYYHSHNVSVREAARQHYVENHTTLLYRLYNTTSQPKSTNGGHNKLLNPAQESAALAYARSQAYTGWPCDRMMVSAAVEHIRNQDSGTHEELPPPSKTWLKNFMRAHEESHIIRWKPLDKKRRAAQDVDWTIFLS
jgi:hypothetical protein